MFNCILLHLLLVSWSCLFESVNSHPQPQAPAGAANSTQPRVPSLDPVLLPVPDRSDLRITLIVDLPPVELDRILVRQTLAAALNSANDNGPMSLIGGPGSGGYRTTADGIASGVILNFRPSVSVDISYALMTTIMETIRNYWLREWYTVWQCRWSIEMIPEGRIIGTGSWMQNPARSNLQEITK